MGFFKNLFSEKGKGKEEIVSGRKLICSHCGNDRFINKSYMLNTQGATFLDIEWTNQTAENYICDKCGFVHWFYQL